MYDYSSNVWSLSVACRWRTATDIVLSQMRLWTPGCLHITRQHTMRFEGSNYSLILFFAAYRIYHESGILHHCHRWPHSQAPPQLAVAYCTLFFLYSMWQKAGQEPGNDPSSSHPTPKFYFFINGTGLRMNDGISCCFLAFQEVDHH